MEEKVNHPSHYSEGRRYEPIEVMDHWAGYTSDIAQAIKYISRDGRKNPNEAKVDLEKAKWYLNHYLHRMEDEWADPDPKTICNDWKLSDNLAACICLLGAWSETTDFDIGDDIIKSVIYLLDREIDYLS